MPNLQRIMYVEDEPDIREIAKLALEVVGGFTVQLCGSGHDAKEIIDTFKPDLVLLDVMMPGMDGPTTYGALREKPAGEKIPIIFLTAKVQPSEVEHLLKLGAAGVIAKPFDPMALAGQVRDVWNKTQI